jgi:hypothetical protein
MSATELKRGTGGVLCQRSWVFVTRVWRVWIVISWPGGSRKRNCFETPLSTEGLSTAWRIFQNTSRKGCGSSSGRRKPRRRGPAKTIAPSCEGPGFCSDLSLKIERDASTLTQKITRVSPVNTVLQSVPSFRDYHPVE